MFLALEESEHIVAILVGKIFLKFLFEAIIFK